MTSALPVCKSSSNYTSIHRKEETKVYKTDASELCYVCLCLCLCAHYGCMREWRREGGGGGGGGGDQGRVKGLS